MIRLSKLTDYAVVVLTALARRPGVVQTVPQIADDTGIPAPTVAKLLKTLTRDGLTVSHRGAAGGYALERAADRISIADIITAIDGPISLTECVDGSADICGVESLCPMRGNWEKVNQAVRQALQQVSLADMMAPADFLLHPPAQRPLDGASRATPAR